MQYKKVAVAMIESTFEEYKSFGDRWEDLTTISEFLNQYDIPVWRDMSDGHKQNALEYVYHKRHTIELNSDCVSAWVQATAYFMLYRFASLLCVEGKPEMDIFFDDFDFMMEGELLQDDHVQETPGISPEFTKNPELDQEHKSS